MQVGYNTNIPYKGKVYHVQTEDTGIESYQIISLLYYKGAILHSRKSNYENLKDDPELKEKVREMMKDQHKVLCKELIAGKHTKVGDEPTASGAEPTVADVESTAGEVEPAVEIHSKPETAIIAEPDPVTVAEKKELEKEAKNLDDILIDYIMQQAGKK